ncbi:tetratricopeptide repeat protein 41 [Conger conger]|uniref:tetratricopeptide repeat protein 41 n=1 Tax=Conger conger TaxID=82655 RepID=UPI002A5A3F05|nr:tetratricopeptide repeat protein 41 [Conger conger]
MSLQEEGSGSTLPATAPLQPFLSSVPEDLHQEREYLRAEVFPHLDSLCRARGTCFKPVELREGEKDGVEGEGERDGPPHRRHPISSQRLKISLDLVGNAPFFLCMLGHRYGQCRPEGAPPLPATQETGRDPPSPLERNLYTAGRNGYPWVLQGRNQTCSFTELEVTQALLTHGPGTSFFYFRDYSFGKDEEEEEEEEEEGQRELLLSVWSSQSEYERRRARELKLRIADGCLPVRFFRSLSELGQLVRADWVRIIDQLYPLHVQARSLDPQGLLEHWCHESAAEHLCRTFVPWAQAERALETLDSFALSAVCDPDMPETRLNSEQQDRESHASILLLCGARGCGKSALAAWWLQQFRKKNPGIPIVPQFSGFCSSGADVRSLLRSTTFLLRQAHYGAQAQWSERVEERVELGPLPLVVQAFSAAAALGPCVLLLDGLDQLTDTLGLSAQQVKELQWLPETLPSQCRLIVTTTSTDLSYTSLVCRPDVRALSCPGQSEPVVRRTILLSHRGLPSVSVPESLLQSIVGKRPALLPAPLAILGSELRTCGVLREEEEEEELLERYLETETLPELWALVIRRWLRDYSWVAETRTGKRRTKLPYPPEPATPQFRGWVWDTLCLLHVSRSGLGKEDLLHCLRVLGYRRAQRILPQHWALFRTAAGPWIRESPGGQLTLTHQSLGQAVELLLLKNGGRSRRAYRRVLVEGLQRGDRPSWSQAKVLEEVAWGLEQGKAWEELHALLTDPDTVELLSRSPVHFQLKTDVVRYWTRLGRAGYDALTSLQGLLAPGQPGPMKDRTVTGVAGSSRKDAASHRTFVTEVQRDGGAFSVLQEPEVKGRIMAFSAEVLFGLGKVPEAEQTLLQMEALLQQAVGPEGGAAVALLHVQHGLAELSTHSHQPHRAETHCRSALESAQLLITAHAEETEHAQQLRGQLLCKLCQLLIMIGCPDEVPGILEEIGAVNHASAHPCAEATVRFLQGLSELHQGSEAAAERFFRVALATRGRWYGPEHPLVAEVEEHLADVLVGHCRETEVSLGEAAQLYRHVLQVKGQEAGPRPPTSPLARPIGCSLAVTLVKLGKLLMGDSSRAERGEAVALLERALDLRVRLLSPDHQLTREVAEVLRSEVSGSGRPSTRLGSRSAFSAERTQTGKSSRSRSPGNKDDQSRALTDTPYPIRSQNRSWNQSRASQRPGTACQTSVFGPGSSISDLDPAPRVHSPSRVLHKSAWFHLPGRYPIKHPERQLHPPKTTTHPERQLQQD